MDVTNKEFINKLSKHELNKNIVIYSNEKNLMNYEIIGTYENKGQVEIHIKEGKKLD